MLGRLSVPLECPTYKLDSPTYKLDSETAKLPKIVNAYIVLT